LISLIDPYTDGRWLDFLSGHPAATIFHHPQWIRSVQETYGYRPMCIGVFEEEKLCGILPLLEVSSWITGSRAVCLPFSDACAPLLQNEEHRNRLGQYLSELLRLEKWKYVEIRGEFNDRNFSPSAVFKVHQLSLQNTAEEVFKGFKKTQTQQRIQKAEREGVTTQHNSAAGTLDDFIRLNALTRKKHGLPPQPDKFFLSIYSNIIKRDLGFILTAHYRQRVIAAAMFFHFQKVIYYKYSASDQRYLNLRPNNLLLWSAIRWGCDNGYALFDFGRTEATNEGLLQFKRGWGAVESDLCYCRLQPGGSQGVIHSPGLLARAKPIFQRLPVPTLKLIGKIIYRHVG
jgi:CelD/BcsL family acetyltransferase involved in cellulose biosynthesis